jgi:cytochrome c5
MIAAAAGTTAFATEAAAQGGMMEQGRAPLPELLPEQLPDPKSEGADLTVRYCAQCHNLPSPATHSAEEWREVMSRMDRYMSEGKHPRGMMRIQRPTAEEREALLQYLQRNALRPFSGPSLPDAGSPGAERFKTICGRCHAIPDPGLHTAGEWPAVVERMRQNMKVMAKPAITDAERNEIADYLKRHARQGTE